MNLNAKSNPNPDLQKTCKRSWKKNVQKIITCTTGFEPMSSWLNKHDTKTTPLHQQLTVDLVLILGLLTYMGKKKCNKKKTNTVPNPTTNPNPTIDEEKESSWNKLA